MLMFMVRIIKQLDTIKGCRGGFFQEFVVSPYSLLFVMNWTLYRIFVNYDQKPIHQVANLFLFLSNLPALIIGLNSSLMAVWATLYCNKLTLWKTLINFRFILNMLSTMSGNYFSKAVSCFSLSFATHCCPCSASTTSSNDCISGRSPIN